MRKRQFINEVVGRILGQGSREADPNEINPHEIDGNIYPDGVQEFDATESLPNPIDEMRPINPPSSFEERMMMEGSPIGRSQVISPGHVEDIIRYQSSDKVARPIGVILEMVPVGDFLPDGVVIFNGEFPDGLGSQGMIPTFLIRWGIGGIQYRAEIDCYPGTMLTLNASFVHIQGSNKLGNANDVTLRASMSPGVLKGRTPHLSYQINADLPAAAALTRSVPPFANRVIGYRAPTTGSFRLRFDGVPGVPSTRSTEIDFAAGVSMTNPVPIPGGCNNVALVNTSAAALTGATLVFDIEL